MLKRLPGPEQVASVERRELERDELRALLSVRPLAGRDVKHDGLDPPRPLPVRHAAWELSRFP